MEYNGKIYGFLGWESDREGTIMILKDLQTGEEINATLGFNTKARFTDNDIYRDEQINKVISD